MGLFDGFMGGGGIDLAPRTALIAGLIFMSMADGVLEESEIGDILRVVPDRKSLETALKYCQRNNFQTFLDATARALTPAQKLCLMLNAVDLAMGDGHLAPREQQMLMQMAQYYQIPENYLAPYVQAFVAKNNRTVFG